jgi:predicted LPLAT superfamily acyltransferase
VSRGPRRWSSRSLASAFAHRLFYAFIRLGGLPLAYLMLAFVAVHYTLKPSVRARSRAYLGRRFPHSGALARLAHAYRLHLAFGKMLIDRAALGLVGRGEVLAEAAATERLRALNARGRGLVLLTAHAGGWQLALAGLGFLPGKKHVLYRRDPGDVDRQSFEHEGGPAPAAFIDPGGPFGGSIEVLSALRRGETVCAMGDRVFGADENVLGVSFLGGQAALPFALYRMAAAAGAPLAVVFAPRTGPGRVAIELAEVVEYAADPGRGPEAYRPAVTAFARALEGFVARHPYQFFNFYDLWQPGEAPAAAKETA